MKWMRRCLAVLLLAGVGVIAALLVYRQLALPIAEGRLRVEGLRAGLQIERDAQGVPTIRAASIDDAWFGLGFVHAQDRLWQLETHRRIGAGRLAEAFGPRAVESDRFLRALGVRRAAQDQWEQAGPGVRAMLNAYAAGINAYLRGHLRARPPEFLLLGLQPEAWSPVDSLAWSTMMAWDLGGNWSTELLRMRLALTMPVARIQQLLPPYPGEKPLATADYAALYRRLELGDGQPPQRADGADANGLPWQIESGVEGVGSNNWAVAGTRSVTGSPLLANDPHLKLSAPTLWYVARLEAPGLKVAGASIPGLPLIVLGQNERVAWGYTNTAPDVQDLYIERIDTGDPERYETPDGWAHFENVPETIRVKGAADVSFIARRTRHGPVLSDALPALHGVTGAGGPVPRYALALRWTALELDASDTLAAGLAFNLAGSVDEFLAASAQYMAPMQNMVVADAQHIGFVSAGRVPLRRPDNDLRGLVPAPGWDARYDWAGWLAPTATPRDRDPARGWIASANQRIHGPQYPHFISSEWAPPYRQQRIERLLAARPLHSLDSLASIQADLLSTATQRLLPFLRQAHSVHPLAPAAQHALEGFEGTMAAERAAPLIFMAWVRQLTWGLFADDLGEALFMEQMARRSFREALEGVLDRNDTSWCDDLGSPAVETCAEQVDAAFTRALDELQTAQGDDVSQWRWGQAHQARLEHRPFSSVPWLARWFELRSPVGGDAFTVNASRVSLRPDAGSGELYLGDHGAGLRALYDLGARKRSRFIHSSGQSGIVFSADYRNLNERWSRVEYLPLWGDGRPGRILELEPR
ncbi:penicillin acylase family protein [Methylibium sp. Pch-M]|uniref:penicillin acylase family protein n=1 Tax=Methylibium sp. Pch-M TaxID=2082386 RepID=UPI00101169A8|nr:penicillin acylase family protein [Methylibium sp. Pch-M]QAZ41242.1 penicillin acylase family protein [Methylibium sp. Pch-M]